MTRSGRRFDTSRHASTRPGRRSATPRSRAAIDLPLSPRLRIESSAKPSSGTTRPSIPSAVPANEIRGLRHPRQPFAGHCNTRVQVTACSAAGYHHPQISRFGHLACFAWYVSSGYALSVYVLPCSSRPTSRVVSRFSENRWAVSAARHASDAACCETFNRMPIPTRLMSSDEPPALTNGSGIPFVGKRPSTTLMLKNACTATIVVRPRARNDPKLSGARNAIRSPRQLMTQKQIMHHGRADETELLGNHRVDEIRVRFGKIEELLHAIHQASTPDATRADGDERLDDLKACAERVFPGVEKGQHPLPPVGCAHDEKRDRRQCAERRAEDVGVVEASGEDHHGGDDDQRHRGAKVRLEQDQPNQAGDDDADGDERVPQLVDPMHPAFEQGRDEKDGDELGQLRWLDAQSADREPASRVVHRRTEQHRDQTERHEDQRRPDEGRLPVGAVVNPHHDAEHRHPERGPHRLLGQEEVWAAGPLHRHDGRCAVHHHDAETNQQERGGEQDAVGFELTSHVSSRGSRPSSALDPALQQNRTSAETLSRDRIAFGP